ncbi:tRNA pseudouridine(38-40) synthase TruA [Spiroplasma endosymbiont of Anurida maritima]|uniref:tRNA pseudouridine(38-40) synthase TruA n=1 Tax=Spiroplasma endosymbiont of Anurida maritima TaxID=2967972 RepID=UPI0036D361C2
MPKTSYLYLLLTLEYDGFNYHGFIKQNDVKTIQGEVESAFFSICNQKLWTIGASKTDAGVHAEDQKILVKLPFHPVNLDYFIFTLNKILPLDINIKEHKIVDRKFSVRGCKQKEYIYKINDGTFDLKMARYELKVDKKLDVTKLQEIANIFIGKHDFFNLSGVKRSENKETVRKIDDIVVKRLNNDKINVHFFGKGFIRYQVRMIMQNILECYNDKITIEKIKQQIQIGAEYDKTIYCAKPYGLTLKKIHY